MTETVNGTVNGIDFTFDLQVREMEFALEPGAPGAPDDSSITVFEYFLQDEFSVNLSTGDVTVGPPPESDTTDFVFYQTFNSNVSTGTNSGTSVGTYSIVFVDNGEASTFTQTLDFPNFGPSGLTGELSLFGASLGGSLTQGGNDGVGLEANGQTNTVIFTIVDGDGNPIPQGTLGLGDSVTADPGAQMQTNAYGPFNTDDIFPDCTSGCFDVQSMVSFNGTGGGDNYVFNGSYDFRTINSTSVAEPSTKMTLIGLGVLGVILKKSKRS
ncbi:MAG: hypothetical protein AB4062_20050 [Crocosphaera sp.]